MKHAILLITLLLVSCTAQDNSVQIGAILPLTGVASISGIATEHGMRIAVDELNANGGLTGKQIDLIVQDSKADPKEGVTAFEQLTELCHVDAVISTLSSVSLALVPLAEQKKTPLLFTQATDPFIVQNNWTVRYYPTAEDESVPLVRLLSIHSQHPAILYLDDNYGRAIADLLQHSFPQIIKDPFTIDETDFRIHFEKIRIADGIVVIGFSSHLVNAFKQFHELGLNATLFTASTGAIPDVRKTLSDTVYLGVPAFYFGTRAEQFTHKYQTRFNSTPDHYAASGYDSIHLLARALEHEPFVPVDSFEGLLGKTFVNGRDMRVQLLPAEVSEQEIVPI
ncbi:MAG TPA: ABC transporter substrate-binding protein [Candidatus Nanoarchaeia archaeon]|nr:ABC transporter substrate-binding protein [Candidatus Nanoarchaeia archaeon]